MGKGGKLFRLFCLTFQWQIIWNLSLWNLVTVQGVQEGQSPDSFLQSFQALEYNAPQASNAAELAAIVQANVQVIPSTTDTENTFLHTFPFLRYGPWHSSKARRYQNGKNQLALRSHKAAVQDNVFADLQGVDIRGASDWAMCYALLEHYHGFHSDGSYPARVGLYKAITSYPLCPEPGVPSSSTQPLTYLMRVLFFSSPPFSSYMLMYVFKTFYVFSTVSSELGAQRLRSTFHMVTYYRSQQ